MSWKENESECQDAESRKKQSAHQQNYHECRERLLVAGFEEKTRRMYHEQIMFERNDMSIELCGNCARLFPILENGQLGDLAVENRVTPRGVRSLVTRAIARAQRTEPTV